jgi:hypothetical protein
MLFFAKDPADLERIFAGHAIKRSSLFDRAAADEKQTSNNVTKTRCVLHRSNENKLSDR